MGGADQLHRPSRGIAIAVLLTVWETFPRLNLVDATFLPPLSQVLPWTAGNQVFESVWLSVLSFEALLFTTQSSNF